MTKLEDILKEKYADLLSIGKKKKPKDPKKGLPDYSITSTWDLSAEIKRLRQKCRDLGIDIDLGERREEDDLKIKPSKMKESIYKELGGSVNSLSDYLIKEPIEKNIYNINTNNYNYKNIKEKIYSKELFYKNTNYNISNILSKNFSSIQYSPLGLNLTLGDSASITADNIGEFALPIVEYIHQEQFDYVIASDRGARLLGLAVFRLYNKVYGRFPTSDETLRFRRFSKSNTREATEKHIQPLADEMLQHKKKPTVLVLDDWVVSGGTKRLAQETFDRLGKGKIKVKFGVLIGDGADVSGHGSQISGFAGSTDWRDDSNIIGVSYNKDNDSYNNSGIKAQPVRSEQARDYRRRMYDGIDKLVERIIKEGKEAVIAKK